MPQKKSNSFDIVKRMVRDHLKDAESRHSGSGEDPGPKADQCYTAAFSTATGAYAGQGITAQEWAKLHEEVRDHQKAFG